MEARNAAKAFIINDGKLLLIKRRPTDVQTPNIWEGPGGRLEIGEDPILGLKREVREEVGLDIEVVMPFSVKHFNRDDGQTITLTIFLCKALDSNITLSEEHTEYDWVKIEDAKEKLTDFFHEELDLIKKFNLLEQL